MPTLPNVTITQISPLYPVNPVKQSQFFQGALLVEPRFNKQLRQFDLIYKGLTFNSLALLEQFIMTDLRYNVRTFSITFPYTHTINAATNATPIVVTTAFRHGFSHNDQVVITSILGNTAANGTFYIYNVTGATFALRNSVGNGTFSQGADIPSVQLYLPRVRLRSPLELAPPEKVLGPNKDQYGLYNWVLPCEQMY